MNRLASILAAAGDDPEKPPASIVINGNVTINITQPARALSASPGEDPRKAPTRPPMTPAC